MDEMIGVMHGNNIRFCSVFYASIHKYMLYCTHYVIIVDTHLYLIKKIRLIALNLSIKYFVIGSRYF